MASLHALRPSILPASSVRVAWAISRTVAVRSSKINPLSRWTRNASSRFTKSSQPTVESDGFMQAKTELPKDVATDTFKKFKFPRYWEEWVLFVIGSSFGGMLLLSFIARCYYFPDGPEGEKRRARAAKIVEATAIPAEELEQAGSKEPFFMLADLFWKRQPVSKPSERVDEAQIEIVAKRCFDIWTQEHQNDLRSSECVERAAKQARDIAEQYAVYASAYTQLAAVVDENSQKAAKDSFGKSTWATILEETASEIADRMSKEDQINDSFQAAVDKIKRTEVRMKEELLREIDQRIHKVALERMDYDTDQQIRHTVQVAMEQERSKLNRATHVRQPAVVDEVKIIEKVKNELAWKLRDIAAQAVRETRKSDIEREVKQAVRSGMEHERSLNDCNHGAESKEEIENCVQAVMKQERKSVSQMILGQIAELKGGIRRLVTKEIEQLDGRIREVARQEMEEQLGKAVQEVFSPERGPSRSRKPKRD